MFPKRCGYPPTDPVPVTDVKKHRDFDDGDDDERYFAEADPYRGDF